MSSWHWFMLIGCLLFGAALLDWALCPPGDLPGWAPLYNHHKDTKMSQRGQDLSFVGNLQQTADGGMLAGQPHNHAIYFHRFGKLVGTLDFSGPVATFEGEVALSAQMFFKAVAYLAEQRHAGYEDALRSERVT